MPQTIGTLGLQQNPAAEIEALGPIGWWRLNDTSGSTVVAKAGSDGSYINSPSLDSGPLAIDGGSFTSSASPSAYTSIPDDYPSASGVNASRSAFTMMAFCLTTDITSSGNQVLFEVGGAANGSAIHITGFDDFDCMAWSSNTIRSRVLLSNYISTNTIYHIAYGYDASVPTTVLYINGESVGSVLTNTGVSVGTSLNANGIGASAGGTRNAVGGYGDGAFPWRGRIGDVAYFDYLLTQSQVRRIARQNMTT